MNPTMPTICVELFGTRMAPIVHGRLAVAVQRVNLASGMAEVALGRYDRGASVRTRSPVIHADNSFCNDGVGDDGGAVHAQQPPGRAPVRLSDTVTTIAPATLHDAVAAAWNRDPQRRAIGAREDTAAARYTAGGALFPNAPSLTTSHVNDKVAGSNYNYITTQAELDMPVWLPGEGTATQGVACAQANVAAADGEAAHLALAAEVLDLAMQAALAGTARAVAGGRLAVARALATAAGQRLRVGEGSESDSLAADADAASAQIALRNAAAQYGSAVAAFASVTGTTVVPPLAGLPPRRPGQTSLVLAAAQTGDGGALSSHPQIVAAERAVAAAQEQARLIRIENRDSPQIGVQGINEKQPGARWDTRFGVVIHFPFASGARNAPRWAEAEQGVTEALVRLELTCRRVTVAVQQADITLAEAEQAAVAARRAAASLDKWSGQIERAWGLGEMPLIEVVRADSYAFDADLARDTAQTEVDAARHRARLAEGVLL